MPCAHVEEGQRHGDEARAHGAALDECARYERAAVHALDAPLDRDEHDEQHQTAGGQRQGGRDAGQGEGAARGGCHHAPGGNARHAEQEQAQAQRGKRRAHAVEPRTAALRMQCRQQDGAQQHEHEVDAQHAERDAESGAVHERTERKRRERGDSGRSRDGAERDGAPAALEQPGHESQDGGRDETGSQAHDESPAPGERQHVGCARGERLAGDGKHEADAQRASPTPGDAQHAAGNHEGTCYEGVHGGCHLDVAERGAQLRRELRHGDVHGRVVACGADLRQDEGDERRVRWRTLRGCGGGAHVGAR